MEWFDPSADWAGRWLFLRALASVYLVAFLVLDGPWARAVTT